VLLLDRAQVDTALVASLHELRMDRVIHRLLISAHAFRITFMHVGGREDEDEGDAALPPSDGREPQHRDELAAANDFVRDVAGRLALELATTPEGRAAGLSVEVWPTRGVALRVRTGHELQLLVERRDDGVWVLSERLDPGPRGGRARASRADLGPMSSMTADDLQLFLSRWLALRVHG
jgi:hypothetical protein